MRDEHTSRDYHCGRVFFPDLLRAKPTRNYFANLFIVFFHFSGLWGLVNNAGITAIGPIEWLPLEKYKRLADVNLWGMIEVTKTFLPLVKNAQGRVVNFSSMLGEYLLLSMLDQTTGKAFKCLIRVRFLF